MVLPFWYDHSRLQKKTRNRGITSTRHVWGEIFLFRDWPARKTRDGTQPGIGRPPSYVTVAELASLRSHRQLNLHPEVLVRGDLTTLDQSPLVRPVVGNRVVDGAHVVPHQHVARLPAVPIPVLRLNLMLE